MGTVTCGSCGRELDERSDLAVKPPSPHCGSTSRSVAVSGVAAIALAATGKAVIEKIHERIERRWRLYALIVGIVVATSLLGLAVSGWIAVVVSLALGLVGVVLGDRAVSRIVTIERTK
jgi:hypothetical protein